ncbi:glycoside hydrolase family 95 protein [Polaribacter sp.]|nr:glycoside hydrolase family 95 protein [Polaribacter sp.]
MFFTAIVCGQQQAYKLLYNTPASDFLPDSPRKRKVKSGFMEQALPIGNGRLGLMFNGGIDTEYLVLNEITTWMNTSRGMDEVSQSGVQLESYKHLEDLRKATRNGQYGTGKNSIESLGTKYFGSKTKLGNYAPFSNIFISTGHNSEKVEKYQRSLDLETGIGSVNYKIGTTNFTREYFCSYLDDIVVVKYKSDGELLNLKIKTATKHKTKINKASGNQIILEGETPMIKNNMEFMQIVHIISDTGSIQTSSEEGVLSVNNAKDVTVYISGYSDYLPNYPTFKGRNFRNDTKNTISKALEVGYHQIKKNHSKDVSNLMDRCQLNLEFQSSGLTTDELLKKEQSSELENLYFNYARYLQTACSRGTAGPSNLQGIWSGYLKPMWNSDYHNDINLAMNYWMVETTNLPELFSPYLAWMKIIAESGKYTAKEAFGAKRGWSSGLNSNVFGFTAQNEHGRRMQHSGAWLSQNLYEHFSFSRDKKQLEEIYPIIKGAAEFYLEFLAPWKDGTLLVYPTWSPENDFLSDKFSKLNKQSYGASYDQQLIYNLFVDCIEASVLLNIDEDFRQELKNSIPKFSPQKIGQYGQLQEWPEDLDKPDDDHRHISHLIALHPGRDISLLTNAELANAAQTTLNHRHTIKGSGWTTAWRISFWARLQNGNKAYEFYKLLCKERTNLNLFNGKDYFQIDGNFGGPAGVCEMLLQSHLRSINIDAKNIKEAAFNGYQKDAENQKHFYPVVPDDKLAYAPYIIHLLPALPDVWANGSVKGLRARGGFEVDIDWKKGKLEKAKIYAINGGDFRIYLDDKLSKVITLKKGESINWNDN